MREGTCRKTLTLKFTFWITCWGSLSRITLQDQRETRKKIGDIILSPLPLPSIAISCRIPPLGYLPTDFPQVRLLPHHGEPSALILLDFKSGSHTLGVVRQKL